ncbi:hypothetical protein PIB30_037765 [Stylosanthes scabra]|uniref:Uncharacterized protein n=1 Tax=Stylosanthes scabra TaxID=79078 RepID=A0ABU6VEY6_9FABA|nr:hypothetical protein [Stylosanthes scabra]
MTASGGDSGTAKRLLRRRVAEITRRRRRRVWRWETRLDNDDERRYRMHGVELAEVDGGKDGGLEASRSLARRG